MKNWSYTIGLLALYLILFRMWQSFPGRSTLLIGAAVTVALMTIGMARAARRRYFANRRDMFLHALVILDVGLEGVAFEVFRLASLWIFGADADVATFHQWHNFYICAAVFGLLVGGYHYWALRAQARISSPHDPEETANSRSQIPVQHGIAG